ncbi:ABC-type nitrate/sulfonate/bicarbonate transport system, periplasmic component [Shewanella psychrophila]|uniref:ABC-type nitrate/sulfonate/bicarbonate transport system, periplasmic component n=1 Tax=Shewanella psychrophila TaxID=225848 RepID=A0A1S6HU51_9GAMM|nr:ABC transporter substrate-binding protein [Shewanella psychrophila]AQS39002.1 ABC-type nitrate/sulfonate/bicarbonate transport system, periplasmic component [Shewanella psychrophila]
MSASVRSPHRFITYLAFVITLFFVLAVSASAHGADKKVIKALYIPLADHYASIVAYERYREQMKYADYQIEQMKNWDLLRAYFQSGEVDMAYVMSPLAMDMFSEKPHFRWIGLMHRDGNALAINDLLNEQVKLSAVRHERKPDDKVAKALKQVFESTGRATEIGMPHLLATHTVVLYRYLKEHGLTMSLTPNSDTDVLAIAVAPPKSPSFIKSKSNRAQAAAFEQSLPWADVVETGGFGHVAWYSKDVMPWEHGHVECIALATDSAIKDKRRAVHEVMDYIHKAGEDIEIARAQGGEALEEIVKLVRKHIPAHTRDAIIASLDPDLRVINYQNLNVDKPGLKLIMDLAVEGGIIKNAIDIEDFADEDFSRNDLAGMSQVQLNR